MSIRVSPQTLTFNVMFILSRKRYMRRLCYLLGSATFLAVILAIIASVIIIAKVRMYHVLVFSYLYYYSLATGGL